MFKRIMYLSFLLQNLISLSVEVLGNECGEVLEDPVPPVEQPADPAPAEEDKKPVTKNDLLRELSKEHGVNLFDVDGLKQFKEFTDSQKTTLEKANEQLEKYKEKEAEWAKSKLEYESKMKASELGISPDNLEDALTLAGGDVNKLAEVVKKYPMFKSKEGITIGIQTPNNQPNPKGLSEAEKFMQSNPKIYGKSNT